MLDCARIPELLGLCYTNTTTLYNSVETSLTQFCFDLMAVHESWIFVSKRCIQSAVI